VIFYRGLTTVWTCILSDQRTIWRAESALMARSAKVGAWHLTPAPTNSSGIQCGRFLNLALMRIRLWRSAHNCLPSGDQLQHTEKDTIYCIHLNLDVYKRDLVV
jgi:hypothetical protein